MTENRPLPRNHDLPAPFAPVATELLEVEELIRRQLAAGETHLAPAATHTLETGGKRLRPAAFLLLVKLLEEQPGLPHLVVAAVLELCHTASLLHDDVLDHAALRRGRTSLNSLRGNRETILFGDHILAGAFKLLADLSRPELVSVMAALVREVCSGEIRQWTRRSFDLTEDEYLAMVRAKTASFFRFAGTLVGRMVALGKAQTAELEAWGDAFGVAYQIADDVYDLVSPSSADKTTGQDARAGLLTLPWIRLRDRHGKRALRDRYLVAGDRRIAGDRPLEDALAESVSAIDRWIARAQTVLDAFPPSEVREALSSLGFGLGGKVRELLGA